MKKIMKYRQDYQPSHYLIDEIHLTFELDEEKTKVTTQLKVRVNPDNSAPDLVLNGNDQQLESVKLNGCVLNEADYQLSEKHLTILGVPAEFDLEMVCYIEPQNNTSLMGLYRTNGTFCTQCEAEGFRRITYYIDRPDILAVFTVTIIADKAKYPVLLSNGNLTVSEDLADGRHCVTWHDPFKKSCHLFAMVAGDLAHLEDRFTTMTGREITLKVFTAAAVVEQATFAMTALKKAMRWDEENYGREYDLDIFMIVAVNDFNFGAMENKGLNIFNDRYILANPETATDRDYANIDGVVAHEYFHNWSGNRVTLRDWFQLSLKEGFTVFRDQTFSQSVGLETVERIQQVQDLRAAQFVEDAGPLAHSVRPDAYLEINNFYTSTVYEKGAELIRMLRLVLGPEKYRQGTDLYFSRNDGLAVTCDDFVQALQDASGIDLTQFKRWYSQSGTPQLKVTDDYDAEKKEYRLHCEQSCPATPGQAKKENFFMPVAVGLLDQSGKEIKPTTVLILKEKQQTFMFENIASAPIPSLLRGFSAPVKLTYQYSEEMLATLMAYDTDGFVRWEAAQQFMLKVLVQLAKQYQVKDPLVVSPLFLRALEVLLKNAKADLALAAEMLTLPEETCVGEQLGRTDVTTISHILKHLKCAMATACEALFLALYKHCQMDAAYEYNVEQVAKRRLRNTCLHYLMTLEKTSIEKLCYEQFKSANNMTDQYAAFFLLIHRNSSYRQEVIDQFYHQWQHDPLVLDKWFGAQVLADRETVFEEVEALLLNAHFNLKNPNKVRSVLGAFTRNFSHFHHADGRGYALIVHYVRLLDKINSMVASRLVTSFSSWREFTDPQQSLMQAALQKLAKEALSSDVYEIVEKSLG